MKSSRLEFDEDRLRRVFALLWLFSIPVTAAGNDSEKAKPKIYGIERIQILTTNQEKANDFYYGLLKELQHAGGKEDCNWCERAPSSGVGPIELAVVRGPRPNNLIGAITFTTNDAEALRKLLKNNDVKVGPLHTSRSVTSFNVTDPEGHTLIFIQSANAPTSSSSDGAPGAYLPRAPFWPSIVHVGFVVRNRESMDHFYKDILGFCSFSKKENSDGEPDRVAIQVPDGMDGIEYMLGIPADADEHTLAAINHLELAVDDVRAADAQLTASRMPLWAMPEEPKIGPDGKWRLILHDPDGTLVELIEFQPAKSLGVLP